MTFNELSTPNCDFKVILSKTTTMSFFDVFDEKMPFGSLRGRPELSSKGGKNLIKPLIALASIHLHYLLGGLCAFLHNDEVT